MVNMEDIKRLMLECRYLLSLDKTYAELAKIMGVSEETIYDDLNNKLKIFDTKLYQRVLKRLENQT